MGGQAGGEFLSLNEKSAFHYARLYFANYREISNLDFFIHKNVKNEGS